MTEVKSILSSRDRRKPENHLAGLLWSPTRRALTVVILALSTIGAVSFVDYSLNTLESGGAASELNASLSDPIHTHELLSDYLTTYRDWLASGERDIDLDETYKELAQFLQSSTADHSELVLQDRNRVLNSLGILQRIHTDAVTRGGSSAEKTSLYDAVLPYLIALEADAFELVSDHFQLHLEVYAASATAQYNRAVRTLAVFIILATLIAILIWILVTEQIQLRNIDRTRDAKVAELEDELSHAKQSVTELSSTTSEERNYLATANHELRTPLTSIIGYLDLLRTISTDNAEKDNEVSKYLDVMERNSLVLLEIVEDILTLSKIESMPAEILERIDVVQELKELWSDCKAQYHEKNITIKMIGFEQQFSILADRKRFRIVGRNLASNSLKYSPADSEITLKLEKRLDPAGREKVCIHVSDQGIGIPPEDLPHVFEKFYRASNASTEGVPGTGLGLAIVKSIVESFQGTLEVTSVVGKGSTFSFCLPNEPNEIEDLVRSRRPHVLERAITALRNASPEVLESIAHEHAGATGFYNLPEESEEIANFLNWLKTSEDIDISSMIEHRNQLVQSLETSRQRVREIGGQNK